MVDVQRHTGAWVGACVLAALTVVVLIPATYFPGSDLHHPTLGGSVTRQLIIAGVLLLGSLGFATTRPAGQRDAR